jgi:hypothetical protein
MAFEGYGLKLALAPLDQPTVTVQFEREEEDEDSRTADLYSNPALWGGRGQPDFE